MNAKPETLLLLLQAHDVFCEVRLGGTESDKEKKHSQAYTIVFESPSLKLRWATSAPFSRFRQLHNVCKLTCTADVFEGIEGFSSLERAHHSSTISSWIGGHNSKSKQEDRRRKLQAWLNDLLSQSHLLSSAARGDLTDLWQKLDGDLTPSSSGGGAYSRHQTPVPSSSRNRDRLGSRDTITSQDGISSPFRVYARRESVLTAPKKVASTALRCDALTAILVSVQQYLSNNILPDASRTVTSVTCISRAGEITHQGARSIIGDVLVALWQQSLDIFPYFVLLVLATSSLCRANSCVGLSLKYEQALALQLLFFSTILYTILSWRHGLMKHLQQLALNGEQAQEHLRSFLSDPRVLYSTDPVVHRYERDTIVGTGASPKHAGRRMRTSTIAAPTDLSSSTFEAFDLPDVTAEDKTHWWDAATSHHFSVRGPTYLEDSTKEHPGPALLKLMLMEIYEVEEGSDRHDHVASMGLAKKRIEAISSLPGSPDMFVVNFQIPGDPPVSLVAYFAMPPGLRDRPNPTNAKFLRLYDTFRRLPSEEERLASWGVRSPRGEDKEDGSSSSNTTAPPAGSRSTGKSSWLKGAMSDIQWPAPQEPGAYPPQDFRHERFKLICNITDGPWVVKAAVPAKPALLGKKVVTRYFSGPNYVEADIHVGSSIIACQVTSLCRSFVKAFGADLAVVIQGENDAELPERVLGCAHIHKLDLNLRRKLHEEVEEEQE